MGIVLGLAPAYWVLTRPEPRRLIPLGWTSHNRTEAAEHHDDLSSAKACTDLTVKAMQLRRLAEERQRAQVLLTARQGATATVVSDGAFWRPDGQRFAEGAPETTESVAPELLATPTRVRDLAEQVQADWWELLADTEASAQACGGGGPGNGPPPSVPISDAVGIPLARNAPDMVAIGHLLARVTAALDRAAELPRLTDAVVGTERGPHVGATSTGGNLAPLTVPTSPYVIDWCDRWVYGVGHVTKASPSIPGTAAFREAEGQARSNLLEGLLGLWVDPERPMRDLAGTNPGLLRGLLQLVDAVDVVAQRAPEGDILWVEARLPLAGRSGLMPLVLPFTGQGSNLPYRAAQDIGTGSAAAFAGDLGKAEHYSAILIDGRGLSIRPVLFPRLVTASGRAIEGPAVGDPNWAVRQGYSAYTPFVGQARLMAGGSPLWVRPVGLARPTGEFILSEADANQIHGARIDDNPQGPPLIVLID